VALKVDQSTYLGLGLVAGAADTVVAAIAAIVRPVASMVSSLIDGVIVKS
jgi:hypothetical protein